ncbi:FRAS1-related extracellular matrix protein 3 [Platysternon megacephalum]|uniref:FRAS1-related extracellular matrix protein 3 n=1 Tax=Platysternon megacephalum TaxID=55544 RepID=A0A4D9ED10_9SAUR|nr:FRAS1-related extracellular matrix protein 3 [Platysternon megacephalum]
MHFCILVTKSLGGCSIVCATVQRAPHKYVNTDKRSWDVRSPSKKSWSPTLKKAPDTSGPKGSNIEALNYFSTGKTSKATSKSHAPTKQDSVLKTSSALVARPHIIYTASIVERKNEICRLHENINNSNDAIVYLHKHNKNSKDNCNVWKPTYVVLSKHEEYLNNQLKNCQETTENDKKMYQDHMNQYKEILKQHKAKYSENALAQEYYMKKKEIEEIRNRVLKHSEQFKWKEATLLDILGTSITILIPIGAYLRQKTQDVLKHAAVFTQKSFELEKEADEVEMKINYFKQQFERSTEDQNHSKIIEGKSKKNLEKRKAFKERMFEEIGNLHLLNGKHQQYKPLHLPCIPQKLVQSVQTFRLSSQRTETGEEERDNSMDHSGIASISLSQVDSETQKFNETAGTNNPKSAKVPSIASLKNQMQFRFLVPQEQTTCKQWFENEATVIGNKDAECADKRAASKSKDSAYISQNVHTECFIKSSEDNPEAEGSTEHFLKTPEMPLFIRTSESNGKKAQFPKTPPFELSHNLGCEGPAPKSPAFSFLMPCTQKSPGFNLFDSSVFRAENSSDQTDESYSAGNVNPISPHKDIGSLFGKSENEDAFTFSFPSESSSHEYGDGKDDFSFPFAFGQDQRSSHSSSLKGFHSSSQNTKPFTLF